MNKVLLISGGSRGIGLAAIESFAAAGYRVINLSRSDTNLKIAKQIRVDFGEPEWLSRIQTPLEQLLGKTEKIVLIHNAATLVKDNVRAAPELSRILQINVVAPQQLNEFVIPKMQAGSCILYLGSTLSEKAVANTLSYSTSKHALLGMMRATCQDLVGTGIHTACICPGFTDTEMLRQHVGNNEEVLKSLGQANAFDRLVAPMEIAKTLLFCAENPAINGAALHANLGQIEH